MWHLRGAGQTLPVIESNRIETSKGYEKKNKNIHRMIHPSYVKNIPAWPQLRPFPPPRAAARGAPASSRRSSHRSRGSTGSAWTGPAVRACGRAQQAAGSRQQRGCRPVRTHDMAGRFDELNHRETSSSHYIHFKSKIAPTFSRFEVRGGYVSTRHKNKGDW